MELEIDIENIIKSLNGSEPYIEVIFTQGGCYQFHLFLKSIFPDAIPMMNEDKDHVISLIGNRTYDVTGLVDFDGFDTCSPSDLKNAECWNFSRQMRLSLGECSNCEEPIIV